jgi:CRP-like cAMP-binding protein
MLAPAALPPRLLLAQQLQAFAGLSEDDLRLAEDHWTLRTIARNEFFNFRNSVCRHIGFIVSGLFRVYYVDPVTAEEHDMVFVPEGTFLTSLKSLVTQEACPYYIAALEDAELLVISIEQLYKLYAQSHGWERFGRLLAEQHLVYQQRDQPGAAGAYCFLPGHQGAFPESHPGAAGPAQISNFLDGTM